MALAKRAPRSNSVHARKHCSISYLVSGVIFIRSVRNTRQGGRQLTRPLLAGLEGGGEERQGEKESGATHPVLLLRSACYFTTNCCFTPVDTIIITLHSLKWVISKTEGTN